MRAKVIASRSLSGMSVIAFAIMFLICSGPRLVAQETDSAATPLDELQKQAAVGDVSAMYALGQRYRHGQGTTIDLGKAVEWYGKATQKDHVAAMTQLGRMYLAGRGVGKNDLQAINCFRRGTELGHSAAMNHLGLMVASGTGTLPDSARAAELFRQAADKGDASAMLNLSARRFGAEQASKRTKRKQPNGTRKPKPQPGTSPGADSHGSQR